MNKETLTLKDLWSIFFKKRTTVKFPVGCKINIILDENQSKDEYSLIMHPKCLPRNLAKELPNNKEALY